MGGEPDLILIERRGWLQLAAAIKRYRYNKTNIPIFALKNLKLLSIVQINVVLADDMIIRHLNGDYLAISYRVIRTAVVSASA